MSIIFDMYGNIIPNKVKYNRKLTLEQIIIINKERKEHKTDIDNEKRTYYCNKHNTFHKYLYHGNPSKTYLNCLKSGNIYKFKDNFPKSELFKLEFKRNWKQSKADYYKSI